MSRGGESLTLGEIPRRNLFERRNARASLTLLQLLLSRQ